MLTSVPNTAWARFPTSKVGNQTLKRHSLHFSHTPPSPQVCSLDEAKVVFPTVGLVANLAFAQMGGFLKTLPATVANHQALLTATAGLGVIMIGGESQAGILTAGSVKQWVI